MWRERGTRHLSRRELALSRALRSSCPTVFSLQVLGRKKTGGHEGRSHFLKRKLFASAERCDTDVLAMRTIRSKEHGICMGFPQAGNTLAVAVIGVHGRPARTVITAMQMQAAFATMPALLDRV